MKRDRCIPKIIPIGASLLLWVSSLDADLRGPFTPIEEAVVPGLLESELKRYPIGGELRSLGNPLHLAIVWDHQQPIPRQDPLAQGSDAGPARLRGIRDYYDNPRLLLKYPEIHCTIEFTPSLLIQLRKIIDGYERGEPADRFLELTLKPSDELTEEDKQYLILRFFPSDWRGMIAPHRRYEELRMKRTSKPDGSIDVARTLENYTTQDYLDLQVWFNLSWFHPDFQEGSVELPSGDTVTVAPLIDKGRDFTEDEKLELVDAQLRLLKSIVPVYKELEEEGQIELITAPFSDPVLPLIYDTDLARVPAPGTLLPKRFSYPGDARAQIELAVEGHEKAFGKPPRGIVPVAGSVSPRLIPLVSEAGLKWWTSDEEVLARSLGKDFLTPSQLYRPYRVAKDGRELSIVFRNAELSSGMIARYRTLSGVRAAKDLLMRLYEIHSQSANWEDPSLVILVLEEERLWEQSERDREDFLHFLYSQLSKADWVRTSTVEEYLARFPPKRRIDSLWTGSWVNSDFSAWIGEEEENLAWRYLSEARETAEQADGKVSDEKAVLAREQIYAAEGSQWFWWYGDDFNSPDGDHCSDEMFRRSLKNVYYFLGLAPPGYLEESIVEEESRTPTEPAKLCFSAHDPEGDDWGPGTYTYPADESFPRGSLDLLDFEVLTTSGAVIFRLKFKELTNPWKAPLGFSHQLVNIYLSTRATESNSTGTRRRGANVRFDAQNPWDFLVKVAGWPGYGRMVYSADGELIGQCEVSCNPEEKTVSISVPKVLIGDPEHSAWAYYVLIGCQDGFGPDNYRPVDEVGSRWQGGGNFKGPNAPTVYDMLDPAWNGKTQKEMLASHSPEREELALIYPVILR